MLLIVHTQITTAAVPESVLTGLTVSKLIDKFEDTSRRLMLEGENRGNALLTALGNQVQVATAHAKLAFRDEQNTMFDSLGRTGQDYFTQLNSIVRAASGPVDRAVKVLEIATLDLINLTNRLPCT